MVTYAWCDSRLDQHSLDAVATVKKVRKLDSICYVLAVKLHREVGLNVEDAYELILTAVALHDIGKAFTNYQKTVEGHGNECRANFRYHEVVGASLLAESLIRTQLNDAAKYLITLAVLNHHYTLRDLRLFTLSNFKQEVIRSAGSLVHGVVDDIRTIKSCMSLSSPTASDIFDSLLKVCEDGLDLERSLSYLIAGINKRQGGYEFLRRGGAKTLDYLVSATTGLINISDYLSGYCRRPGRRSIFAEKVLEELMISCDTLLSL